MTTITDAAVEYAAHGWRMVPLGADKRPVRAKWNEFARTVGTVEEAAALRCAGVGLAHAFSGTVAIDVDNAEVAEDWCARAGLGALYLQHLAEEPDAVVILSPKPGRFKLLYRAPEGAPLVTVVPVRGLEFRRAAASGRTMQDVLPPSPHPAGGTYEWAGAGDWRALPALPQPLLSAWLHQLGASKDAPEAPADYPEPMGLSDEAIREVLARIDPDVSYPEWIKVGQALQHERPDDGFELWAEWSARGSKYPGAAALGEKWETFGHSAKPATMRSIIRDYASVATVDEFDIIEDPREEEMAETGLVPMGAFRHGPALKWLIRDLLPAATMGVIYGAPGSGKSFIAIDLMACVARGERWNGRKVRKGRVVYIAAEGEAGLRKRADAYMRHFGLGDDDVADFLFHAGAVNLLSDDWKPFAKVVEAAGGADVIVVDTLAQSMAGGDENTSEDMGKVIRAAQQLHKATGAMVVLIHHSGKDTTRGARGWSGLRGAVDVELSVEKDAETKLHTLTVAKQKDGEDGGDFAFRLHPVELDPDEEGPRYSCVVEHVSAEDVEKDKGLGGIQKFVFSKVQGLCDLADGTCTLEAVVTACVREMVHDPQVRDNRRRDVNRALTALRERGKISVDNNIVRVL